MQKYTWHMIQHPQNVKGSYGGNYFATCIKAYTYWHVLKVCTNMDGCSYHMYVHVCTMTVFIIQLLFIIFLLKCV